MLRLVCFVSGFYCCLRFDVNICVLDGLFIGVSVYVCGIPVGLFGCVGFWVYFSLGFGL